MYKKSTLYILKKLTSLYKNVSLKCVGARDLYEKETKKSALSKNNLLDYKYLDDNFHK